MQKTDKIEHILLNIPCMLTVIYVELFGEPAVCKHMQDLINHAADYLDRNPDKIDTFYESLLKREQLKVPLAVAPV